MADDNELLAELELTGANDVDEQLLSCPVATKDDDMMVSTFLNVPNQKLPTISASNSSTATSMKEAEELVGRDDVVGVR